MLKNDTTYYIEHLVDGEWEPMLLGLQNSSGEVAFELAEMCKNYNEPSTNFRIVKRIINDELI